MTAKPPGDDDDDNDDDDDDAELFCFQLSSPS